MRTSPLPQWGTVAGEHLALAALLLVVALFAPLYGIVFSMIVVWDRNRRGQRAMRNIAAACALLALLAFAGLPVPGLGPHA